MMKMMAKTNYEGVIPKPRVFTGGARDLAWSATERDRALPTETNDPRRPRTPPAPRHLTPARRRTGRRHHRRIAAIQRRIHALKNKEEENKTDVIPNPGLPG
jgi:hypothetical protein